MKQLVFVVISLLTFANCTAQRKQVKKTFPKNQHKMKIPNITKKDITYPNLEDLINKENRAILDKTKDSSKLIKNTASELRFEQNGFENIFKGGKLTYQIKITEDEQKPLQRKIQFFNNAKEFKQSVKTIVDFYQNGNVHTIQQYNNNSNGNYPAGNWYAYDEQGNLLQHIDHELFFKMNYFDIAKIADRYQYPNIQIVRTFDGKNASYWIVYLEGLQHQQLEPKTVIINDQTGKVLYEMNQTEFNQFHDFDYMTKYGEELYRLFKKK